VIQSDHGKGAPVVEELHPNLSNLTGRVEHIASQGVLATNFRLIKPGALHQANGGYLLLDARSLLTEAFSWTTLKRALRSRTIKIEDINQLIGLTTTISLEPSPIPLNVKVVLFRRSPDLLSVVSLRPGVPGAFQGAGRFQRSHGS
jgi:predicted ATP-dependent protease